jgi:hypothetical protein
MRTWVESLALISSKTLLDLTFGDESAAHISKDEQQQYLRATLRRNVVTSIALLLTCESGRHELLLQSVVELCLIPLIVWEGTEGGIMLVVHAQHLVATLYFFIHKSTF